MYRRQALTVLADWITFLFQPLPPKLRPTFLELLLGCMVARSGHVTEALLAIIPKHTWAAYYKAMEKGVFAWLPLARQWALLLCKVLVPIEILLAIDDTIIFRASKKAPSVALHHDHANRPNRPTYVWGAVFCLRGHDLQIRKAGGRVSPPHAHDSASWKPLQAQRCDHVDSIACALACNQYPHSTASGCVVHEGAIGARIASLAARKRKMDQLASLAFTDTSIPGHQIIEKYASRWKVESCFHELKNLLGFKGTWQQTRQVAARWRCFVTLAYFLPRLMALLFGEKLGSALLSIPWRKGRPMTAGWMAKALGEIFRNYRVRAFWDRKSQKCSFPEELLELELGKAA